MARGQAAGRGNNKAGLHLVQREAIVEAQAAAVGVRGAGPSALGTLRAKLQPNLPGETVT